MSTISASTTSSTAYKVSADTTGTLVLQTGATPTTAVTIGTDQNVTLAKGLIVGATAAPAFSAYLSSNQSVTTATFTKVQLNTENFDTNSNFDSTTNYRFTPTVAGYYQINGCMNGESSTTRTRVIASIYRNGSEYKRGSDQNYANANACVVSDVIYFNGSTDYVELYGLVSAVTPLFNGGNFYTYFSGAMVRSA